MEAQKETYEVGDFKKLFIIGAIIIFISVFVQVILFKYNIFRIRENIDKKVMTKVVKAIDHIFTATYYLQKTHQGNAPQSALTNIEKEIESARLILRSPEILKLRQSAK